MGLGERAGHPDLGGDRDHAVRALRRQPVRGPYHRVPVRGVQRDRAHQVTGLLRRRVDGGQGGGGAVAGRVEGDHAEHAGAAAGQ